MKNMKSIRLRLISGALSLSLLAGHAETSRATPGGSPTDGIDPMTLATTVAAVTLFTCWAFGRLCARPSNPQGPQPAGPTRALTTTLLIRNLRTNILTLHTLGGGGGAAGAAAAATGDIFDPLLAALANGGGAEINVAAVEAWVEEHGNELVAAVRREVGRKYATNVQNWIDVTRQLLENLCALSSERVVPAADLRGLIRGLIGELNQIEQAYKAGPVVTADGVVTRFPFPRPRVVAGDLIPGPVVRSYLEDDRLHQDNRLLRWFERANFSAADIERAKISGIQFK
ncbi:MAG: hypothetical protein HYW48_01125 [Deltaproteobacteria bacterium]|nr:hypothetical protein [Deltaproteobacteria bacterium]